jgi:AraC family transcriptional regulator of arabinose operon
MDPRIELIIARIENQPSKPWEVSKLAGLVNLSASRLRHLFKQETGATPVQYLRELRLRRAGELLKTTFLSVKEVMSQVGLTTGGHSVRAFKKMYGVTPTVYRRSLLAGKRRNKVR